MDFSKSPILIDKEALMKLTATSYGASNGNMLYESQQAAAHQPASLDLRSVIFGSAENDLNDNRINNNLKIR